MIKLGDILYMNDILFYRKVLSLKVFC